MREPSDDRPLRGVWGLLAYLASRLRCRAAKAAALWAAAVALAGLSAVVAADAAVNLPPSALFLALGGGSVGVALAAALAYRPRPSTVYLARLVERQRPELKEALVTLVELAADPASDRSMQTALARRAARILSRDPPHAFLPAISWRRPGWALAAGAVTLGAVLWLGQGTAITPWLPGAHAGHVVGTGAPQATVAGTEAAVGGTQGGGGSANLAHAEDAGVRRGAGAAGDVPGTGSPQAGAAGTKRTAGATQGEGGSATVAHAEDAGVRGGAGAAGDVPGTGAPQATVAGTEAAVGGTQGEGGSATVTHAEDAGVRRGAGAAGDSHTGPAPGDHAAGGTRRGDPPGGSGSGVGGAAGESARPRAHPAGPPLPERNPSEAAPENVLDTMRCQKPLIGEEGRPPDEGESPRKFLGQMGVSTADERRYTTAWPSGRQGPYAGPDATPPAGRVRTVPGKADGEVLEPTGNGAARAVVVPHDAGAGERGALIHAAEVRVSPRLRSAVRAYFERIGQLARPDAPSRKDGSP